MEKILNYNILFMNKIKKFLKKIIKQKKKNNFISSKNKKKKKT